MLAGLNRKIVMKIFKRNPRLIDHLSNGLLHVLDLAYQKGDFEIFKFLYSKSRVKIAKLFKWDC